MKSILAAVALLAVGLVGIGAADVVQLNNGETLRGRVISLDEKQLKLHSESLGELSLERGKVDTIYLGNRPAPVTGPPAAPETARQAGRTPKSPDEILKMIEGGPSGGTPQGTVEQLQKEGISKETISDLQKNFPLLSTPEVQKYFSGTIQGLTTGTLNIQDVRKDAIRARNAIDQLQKELGPDAKALSPYRSILDKFIDETTPPPEASTGEQPSPKK